MTDRPRHGVRSHAKGLTGRGNEGKWSEGRSVWIVDWSWF